MLRRHFRKNFRNNSYRRYVSCHLSITYRSLLFLLVQDLRQDGFNIILASLARVLQQPGSAHYIDVQGSIAMGGGGGGDMRKWCSSRTV